jgi:hypothetical protein
MSENFRFYKLKTAELRAYRAGSPELRRQMTELVATVARCEAMWALEERNEKNR